MNVFLLFVSKQKSNLSSGLFLLLLFLILNSGVIKVLNQVGDFIIILVGSGAFSTTLSLLEGFGKLLKGGHGLRTQLVQNTRDELSQFLLGGATVDGKGVGVGSSLNYVLYIFLIKKYLPFFLHSTKITYHEGWQSE
jgi:hypothetical protein